MLFGGISKMVNFNVHVGIMYPTHFKSVDVTLEFLQNFQSWPLKDKVHGKFLYNIEFSYYIMQHEFYHILIIMNISCRNQIFYVPCMCNSN